MRRAAGPLAALAAVTICATALAGGLHPNPANDPRLLDRPLEGFDYDYASRCRDHPPSGTRALARWLDRNVRGELWGIIRCESLGEHFSLHAEGRAIDWHLDAGVRREKRAAMDLIEALLAADAHDRPAALARRMGVQGLIFNCRSWWSGAGGLGRYSYCYRDNGERRRHLDRTQAHMDHVHIELNRQGAREETSFWRSPLAND
jgi:hypothetical protein